MIVSLFDKDQENPELKNQLLVNLKNIQARIDLALKKSKNPHGRVTLVAVSKKQPLEIIEALARLGQINFGENYVQEALAKMDKLRDYNIRWHFIGGLQTNKARYVSGQFAMVHSVDSVKLARSLQKTAKNMNTIQPVLIQVNLAGETQKCGTAGNSLFDLAVSILELNHLKLDGLMTMPPFFDDPEKARPFFAELRTLKHNMEEQFGIEMPHLSMGMSGDFEVAVEEGSTMVRIGESLFGPRSGYG